jgi:peptidoglycan/LPS O-acetylase OafA/YrhL/lysophospholipase L1-like esterase
VNRSGGTTRLAYQPALDGLRAVAVMMVLLFHGGVSWMHGGYFGVSMFFTLSGFLITSLLVREYDATSRVSPGAFYIRRAKRLLPASTVCLAAVSIMATRDAWPGADHLRRDALGAVSQVANWVQLGSGGSYTDLQSKSAGLLSPLDHYWSLAIEEQFYWIWPLAFWGVARLGRHRGWSLTRIMMSMTVVVAAAAPLIAVIWGPDAAYWATPARAAEILIGALLAVALREEKIAAQRWMAPVFLTAVVVIAIVLPATGGPAYHGAFPLLAVASGGLLLGLQRSGRVTSALSWRPLVGLGAISYGVYLFHFPVYVLMSTDRVGRSGWQLLCGRVVVTLTIALASYWVIERPIRLATFTGARTAINAAFAVGLATTAVLFVPTHDAIYWKASASVVAAAEITTSETVVPLAPVTSTSTTVTVNTSPATTAAPPPPAVSATEGLRTVPTLNRPVRIIVLGDSTAAATGSGLEEWAALNPTVAKVTVMAAPGCGFIRAGTPIPELSPGGRAYCNGVLDHDLPQALHELAPDVVMMMTTIPDIAPRVFDPSVGPLTPVDPDFVTLARIDYLAVTNLILANSSAHIVWIKPPNINPYWKDIDSEARDPVVHSVMEGVMGELVTAYPERVALLDMRTWLAQQGLDQDPSIRPDGVHFGPDGALQVAERWLGPELVIEATRTLSG